MLDAAHIARLREQLQGSRATLLAALEGVTERDFSIDLGGGETVVRRLARLVMEERAEVAAARGQDAPPAATGRPLPPQVVHGLAGARHQTLRYLEDESAEVETAEALVAGILFREQAAAVAIRRRPPATPLPEIPVVQPPEGRDPA